MTEVNLIQFFVGFFLNDMFGSYVLGIIFIMIFVFLLIFLSDSPRIAWIMLPTILIMAYTSSGHIQTWIAMLSWIGLGLLWGFIIRELIRS